MKEKPLVSIITVVYNGAKTIQQTFESIRKQTYNNIEYIIVDGGSTDETLSIVKANKDIVSKWISEPDEGLYDAMNKGIKMAKGELVGIINSDDWYETDTIKHIVNAYSKHQDKKIFHGDINHIYEDGAVKLRKFNPSVFKFKYYGMTYNHPSVFVHRDIYVRHLYDSTLRALSDYQFMLVNFLEDLEQFLYIEQVLANYRLDGISAQMPLYKALKECFISQRKSGLNIFQASFSWVFRRLVFFIKGRKDN